MPLDFWCFSNTRTSTPNNWGNDNVIIVVACVGIVLNNQHNSFIEVVVILVVEEELNGADVVPELMSSFLCRSQAYSRQTQCIQTASSVKISIGGFVIQMGRIG